MYRSYFILSMDKDIFYYFQVCVKLKTPTVNCYNKFTIHLIVRQTTLLSLMKEIH
jgi:hypothetical protein